MKIKDRNFPATGYLHLLLLCLFFFPNSNANANSVLTEIKRVERELDARVGVSIYDVKTKKIWNYKGETRFPLLSTFKTLACAKLLADSDAGKTSINRSVQVYKDSLVTYSPALENYADKKITLDEACSAAMRISDNTAANIILTAIGGPQELTKFMVSIGDNITRLDRIEPNLNEALAEDIRDTTTPNAITKTLNTLLFENALSAQSRAKLKQWMMENEVSGNLFRSVLPSGWYIADRSGAGGNGSRAITAVIWSDTHPPLIISVYLTQTQASFDRRNQAIAEIGKEIFKYYLKE
ncbi:MAG TPA: class A beta-lactamase [Arenimonas sp.]|nr:class A beta-lactamase [Arenimonas sp.]